MSVVLPAMNINGKDGGTGATAAKSLLGDTDTVTQVHDTSRLDAVG